MTAGKTVAFSCISSDCWKSQHQQLCGNASTIYHEIGKLRTSPAVLAWFENVQYLAVAYLGVICNISEQQITMWSLVFLFAESHFILSLKIEKAVPDQTSSNKILCFVWFICGLRSFIFFNNLNLSNASDKKKSLLKFLLRNWCRWFLFFSEMGVSMFFHFQEIRRLT